MALRRAEWHTRQRKERARKQAGFLANPFGLTKQQLGQKRSGHLTCPKDEIDHHLRETLSDEARDLDLGHCKALIIPPAPTVEFDSKEPSWKEAQEGVKKARTSSATRQSGVPCRVYKKLSMATQQAMEDLKGDLEEGQGSLPVEKCRRCVDSEGGRVKEHQSSQDHLTAQC